jgi:hypothetical protein
VAAAEPAVYPQTAYQPLLLPTSWQAPVVAQADEMYAVPNGGRDGRSAIVVLQEPASGQLDAQSGLGGDCESCRGGSFFGWHADDWMWGCGGWPFQTGPGDCDTWKVGPVWDVSVDGMTLFREGANLAAITAQAAVNSQGGALGAPELTNQFDYGGGGRVFATGTLPRCAGYRLQFGYEGVEEWNASVVFPKHTPMFVPAGAPVPPADSSEQRRVHYTSNMQSAEFNFQQPSCSVWQPYVGVRYLRFNDELTDVMDQEAPPPLPALVPDTVTTTDTLNLFDLNNQLIGFQVGVRRDLWQICQRVTLQGFVNSGVYYNRIKRTNLMSLTTTQVIGYNTTTDTAGRSDVAQATNNDVAELSDVAYIAEASLTGVCRLNKCVALRGGYQMLWIQGVRLAENAYLGADLPERRLTFQGWHVGVEYRR